MNFSKRSENHIKWKALIAEQEMSGQTQIAFCKQRSLNPTHLTYYRGVLKEKNSGEISQKLFSSIQIKKCESTLSTEIRIILPNGFQCFLPCSLDATKVKQLMGVLLSC